MADNDRGPITHLIGIVGTAPEVKTAGEYGELVEFSLAVSDGFSDEANTTWYSVAVWKDTLQPVVKAQIYKGAKVAVSGWVKTREYDGKTYYSITGSRIGLIEYLVPGQSVAVAAASRPGPEGAGDADW